METKRNVFDGKSKYNHHIKCVEYTKILEREQCDTLAFLRKLGRDWRVTPQELIPIFEGDGADYMTKRDDRDNLYSPQKLNDKIIVPL